MNGNVESSGRIWRAGGEMFLSFSFHLSQLAFASRPSQVRYIHPLGWRLYYSTSLDHLPSRFSYPGKSIRPQSMTDEEIQVHTDSTWVSGHYQCQGLSGASHSYGYMYIFEATGRKMLMPHRPR